MQLMVSGQGKGHRRVRPEGSKRPYLGILRLIWLKVSEKSQKILMRILGLLKLFLFFVLCFRPSFRKFKLPIINHINDYHLLRTHHFLRPVISNIVVTWYYLNLNQIKFKN